MSDYNPTLDLSRRDDRIFAAMQKAGFPMTEAFHEQLCVEVFWSNVTEATPLGVVWEIIHKRTGGRTEAQMRPKVIERDGYTEITTEDDE